MEKAIKIIKNVVAVILDQDDLGKENMVLIWESKKKNRDKILINPPGGKRECDKVTGIWETVEEATQLEVVQETGQTIQGKVEILCTSDFYDSLDNTMIETTFVRCNIAKNAVLSPDDPDGDVKEAMRVNLDDAIGLLLKNENIAKIEPVIEYLINGKCISHYTYRRDESGVTRVFQPETQPALKL